MTTARPNPGKSCETLHCSSFLTSRFRRATPYHAHTRSRQPARASLGGTRTLRRSYVSRLASTSRSSLKRFCKSVPPNVRKVLGRTAIVKGLGIQRVAHSWDAICIPQTCVRSHAAGRPLEGWRGLGVSGNRLTGFIEYPAMRQKSGLRYFPPLAYGVFRCREFCQGELKGLWMSWTTHMLKFRNRL